ncbi:MAG: hypothetical protein ACXW08_05660 [Solirubrobacteraceae bacterium]
MRQGRTDAWIAHQLDVTVQQIQAFKREQDLDANGGEPASEEVDLRAEDDAAIAAELEEEAKRREEEEAAEAARKAEEEAREAEEAARRVAEAEAEAEAEGDEEDDAKPKRPARRPRGGRSRRRTASRPLEGTFDHGDEGYGLWLDPAVQDDPTYAEHWAGHRPVEVTIEEDQIVIRRIGGGGDEDDDD